VVGGAVLTVALLGGTAWAGGNGAQTGTQHVHGDASGLVEIDFNPNSPNTPPGLSLPAGCWLTSTEAIVSTDGNAIMHSTFNKNGGWFTTTYTGGAAVYPLVLDSQGNPIQDENGNNEVNTSAAPLATGHLTTWFGDENNGAKNGNVKVDVEHATASFHGTDSSGNTVNLNAHFHIGTNQYGQPTATVTSATC
jgi:hypothetical protein